MMTEEDEKDYKNNNNCRIKYLNSKIKVRDHCHSTSKNRGPARSECNFNVTQKQGIFLLIIFHNFSNYDYSSRN